MTSHRRITIDPPDGATILAARHLDATEGPVQVGSTVDVSTRSAITCVLGYVSKAYRGASVPASTAPLAAGLPLVQGRCPACGWATLFLGNGGHATCSRIDCPNPCLVDEQLHSEKQPDDLRSQITALRDDLRGITGARWIADMVDKILNPPPPTSCLRCKDRRSVPDWTDWNAEHGEPRPKPCPDCQPAPAATEATKPEEQH